MKNLRSTKNSLLSLSAGVCLLSLAGASFAQAAAPLAGTKIGNQASATYTDQSNTPRETTSNTVITEVLQIPGIALTQDNTRTVSPGGSVFFPHTLTNTGNGDDSYDLFTQNVVDTFTAGDLTNVLVYADTNQDGQPDDITAPITTTGELAPGEQFFFVIGGVVPGSAADGEGATLDIVGLSDYSQTLPGGDPFQNLTADNTDTANVSGDAVITVTKAIDTAQGKPGTTPVKYTLTFTNTGNATAEDVTITDLIPTNMTYVDDSGLSSLTGAVVLTDTDADGGQGPAPSTITYDYNVGSRTITAVIAQVAAGQSGTISFEVTVDANIKPQTIVNVANYSYDPKPGDPPTGPFPTNKPPFEVLPVPAVTLGDDTVASAKPGETVTFNNLLTNNGTTTDTFDITIVGGTSSFPTGTTFKFFQADGQTPMVDSNGNGIPDTGPVNGYIDGSNTYNVVLKATLPTGIDLTAFPPPYSVDKRATGTVIDSDSGLPATDDGTDDVTTIVPPTVDITNATAVQDPDAGAGDGIDTDGLDFTTDPGTVVTIPLTVENEGSIVDAYNLTVDPTTVPAGWDVVIRASAGGAIISNSGDLQPPSGGDGESLAYVAQVTVPEGEDPGDYNITFRAISPTSSASDEIINTISVNTIRELSLISDNAGQVFPGGSIAYSHLLTNLGNVPEAVAATSDIGLGLSDSAVANGWTSVIHIDANNNGLLDDTDPIITSLPDANAPGFIQLDKTGGANDQVRLFVKVFAPLGAPNNAINITTITATPSGVVNTIAAPAPLVNEDTTTVVLGDLSILKEQALDADNDGNPDDAYSTLDRQARPGQSILYRVTVTNTGSADATDIKVFDTTPANTTYAGALGNDAAGQVDGVTTTPNPVNGPANGGTGSFEFTVGTLTPGASAIIKFGVTIDN